VNCLALVLGLAWETEGFGTMEGRGRVDFAGLVGLGALEGGLLCGLSLFLVAC
jgi:hypothetical protein